MRQDLAPIKKNQSPEQRILILEKRYAELETKFTSQTRKLVQVLKDIEQIKIVCNRLHKAGKRNSLQLVSQDATIPQRKQVVPTISNGTDTAKG